MRKDGTNGDILTKIYDRKSFFEKAKEMIDNRKDECYILSCINIDNFKVINAQYGTEIGDSVICHVAMCISECMAKIGGICGHIAGDDFAALFPSEFANSGEIASAHGKSESPECILEKLRLRVGRFIVKNSFEPVSSMYDSAKIAADSIRSDYEKDIEYYKDDMRKDILHTQQIIYEMRNALDLGQFEIWLQPQYNHATGAVIGTEALVRWNKNGVYISPADFVPIFEQNGFIYEMDKYIWSEVCKLLRRWLDENKNPLPMSVNISRKDILHEDFVSVLEGMVKKYSLSADMLRLEITESAFSTSPQQIISKVAQLNKLGFTVEIDDFGSGYSSLNTLKDVPSSVLKLDMRFFESTKNSQRAGNIIESVVRMAKRLGMAVIAEGVEEKSQADYLKSIGCYYIQGYYYAKPMPVSNYEKLLENSKKERELSRLKTLKTLDNNEFWNPKSMDTLIFNSYVGGACIFEYYKGKTDILRLNDQYIKQFGGIIPKGSELHGAAVSKYMDKEGKKALFSVIQQAIDTREEASCEVRVSNKERFEFVRITVRAIARMDECILCYGVVSNITKRCMAQINERNMAKQLDVILSSIHASVTAAVVYDENNMNVIFKNRGFYKIYGYTKEQYEKEVKSINDLIVTDDRQKVIDSVQKAIKTKKTQTYEFRGKKRDGSIIWLQITNSFVKLDSTGEDILLGIATDITNLHKLKENKTDMEYKLKAAFEREEEMLDRLACEAAVYEIENNKIKMVFSNKKYKKTVCREENIFQKDLEMFIAKAKTAALKNEDFECDMRLFDENKALKSFCVQTHIEKRDGKCFLYTTYAQKN